MNRSMPGLPVHHQIPEFTQTHVHRVSDAIQPSHPLSSPSRDNSKRGLNWQNIVFKDKRSWKLVSKAFMTIPHHHQRPRHLPGLSSQTPSHPSFRQHKGDQVEKGLVPFFKKSPSTSMVIQWLRLRAPDAGNLGLIPGQGARSHVPQLRVDMLQLRLGIAKFNNRSPLKRSHDTFPDI